LETINSILIKQINNLKNNTIEESVLKARVLLAHLLGVKKEYLIIHETEPINLEIEKKYINSVQELIKRRTASVYYGSCRIYGA